MIRSGLPTIELNIDSEELKTQLQKAYVSQKREIYAVEPLREYTLADVMVNEEMVRLIRENKVKVIYIDVWATWCSPCKNDMIKSRDSVANELMKGGLAVIYAGTGINENACKKFMYNNEIPGDFIYLEGDASKNIMTRFGNFAYPFQIIISPEGEIVAKGNHYRFTSFQTQKMLDVLRSMKPEKTFERP